MQYENQCSQRAELELHLALPCDISCMPFIFVVIFLRFTLRGRHWFTCLHVFFAKKFKRRCLKGVFFRPSQNSCKKLRLLAVCSALWKYCNKAVLLCLSMLLTISSANLKLTRKCVELFFSSAVLPLPALRALKLLPEQRTCSCQCVPILCRALFLACWSLRQHDAQLSASESALGVEGLHAEISQTPKRDLQRRPLDSVKRSYEIL